MCFSFRVKWKSLCWYSEKTSKRTWRSSTITWRISGSSWPAETPPWRRYWLQNMIHLICHEIWPYVVFIFSLFWSYRDFSHALLNLQHIFWRRGPFSSLEPIGFLFIISYQWPSHRAFTDPANRNKTKSFKGTAHAHYLHTHTANGAGSRMFCDQSHQCQVWIYKYRNIERHECK